MAKRKSFSINSSLSKGLEETVQAAHDFSGQLFVDVIPIDRLELDPENPRELHLDFHDVRQGIAQDDPLAIIKKQELLSLESLSKSIAAQGLINPVVVYKTHDKYRLIAGERRTLSSILAGKTHIEARILDDKPNALNRVILQWMENNEREDLSLWERINNLRSILKIYSHQHEKHLERVTAAELSDLTGMSVSQASQYKLALQASDVVLEAIKENKVNNLDKVALIVKAALQDQESLISLCVQGASLKDLKVASQKLFVHKSEAPSSKDILSTIIYGEKTMRFILDALAQQQHWHIHATDYLDLRGKALIRYFQTVMQRIEQG
jgi:ParB family chromosome partitioning protein